ncbi:MAG: hypothetical protein U0800_21285 [Isosphaeraceae bacterium]
MPFLNPLFLFERRHLKRQIVTARDGRIAWRRRPEARQMDVTPARILNIHQEGASVIARGLPEDCREVWIGLDGLPLEWARCCVQSARASLGGTRYHLIFREPCAPGLIEMATLRRSSMGEIRPFDEVLDNLRWLSLT